MTSLFAYQEQLGKPPRGHETFVRHIVILTVMFPAQRSYANWARQVSEGLTPIVLEDQINYSIQL